MAVSAQTDRNPARSVTPRAAQRGVVDLRGAGRALAGSYVYEGDALVTGWHSHDLHQIEYAERGVVQVETATGVHLLPPQQAAWIPAGTEHLTTIDSDVRTIAVLFDVSLVPEPGDRVRILAVPPLIREMVVHAQRWPIERTDPDRASEDFFRALAHLVADALDHEAPLSLPTSSDPILGGALAYTQDHLGSASAADVSRAVGVSERTLRRRFETELQMPWRTYLLHARLLRAMARLAVPGPSVLDVATEVGFDNVSAFTRAFARHCGETPSAYRRRVLTPTA